MDGDTTKVLLVTANVGSIFEEPTQMFQPWMQAFLQEIQQKTPGVVALHCQEVGGKNYEASMQHVNQFVKNILACEELAKYDRARIFLDEDYTAADRFTALGNLYFIHEDVESVLIWDFVDCKFVAVEGREVLSGNIENVPIKEKAKFPQHFFPEFKWSRKGFLRTRWSINNCIFDLVNIHLFHDASNIVAMESSPSLYCSNRRRGLLHTLQRFENDQYSKVPLFIFGDFNFRLDSYSLIKALTPTAVAQQTLGKKDQVNKVVYTEEGNGKVVLTVESKSFDCHERHADLFGNMIKWLLQYDLEPKDFQDRLCEFDISFPPSYPFMEDVNDGLSYMKTRVPSWCDRILLTHSAKDIISSESHHRPDYCLIGRDTCMGDHKPVSLYVRLKPGKGNDAPANANHSSCVAPPFDIPARRRGLSINGEMVPEGDLDAVNIHDFAIFEKEAELIPEFRVSIKSRSSASSEGFSPMALGLSHEDVGVVVGDRGLLQAGDGGGVVEDVCVLRTPSFKKVAQQVRMVEKVLLHWPCRPRSRHHSSSSEDFCFDSYESCSNNNSNSNNSNSRNNNNGSDQSKPYCENKGMALHKSETVQVETSSCTGSGEDSSGKKAFRGTKDSREDSTTHVDLNSSNRISHPGRDVNLNESKTSNPQNHPSPATDKSPHPHLPTEKVWDGKERKEGIKNSKVVDGDGVPPAAQSPCHGGVAAGVEGKAKPAEGLENKEGGAEGRCCPCTLL